MTEREEQRRVPLIDAEIRSVRARVYAWVIERAGPPDLARHKGFPA